MHIFVYRMMQFTPSSPVFGYAFERCMFNKAYPVSYQSIDFILFLYLLLLLHFLFLLIFLLPRYKDDDLVRESELGRSLFKSYPSTVIVLLINRVVSWQEKSSELGLPLISLSLSLPPEHYFFKLKIKNVTARRFIIQQRTLQVPTGSSLQ